MSPDHDQTLLCARVLDRLVEGDDLSGDRGDPILAEHLGSCVTCFRVLTELRDAPRVVEALRAEAPVAPHLPHPGDQFWDDLATRTTAAAQTELQRALRGGAHGAGRPGMTAPPSVRARLRRSSGARGRIISVAATLAAAAAGFLLVARGPLRSPSGMPAAPAALVSAVRSRTTAPSDRSGTRSVARSVADDAMTDEEADVAELDAGALHRLLDRLRPHAPGALTAPSGGGASDAADVLGDDEARVNEELADLDGDELRRVASSLEAGVF
jgi:hypothetical protein